LRNCMLVLGPRHQRDWHYDTIIIDEGQDIEQDLMSALVDLLRDIQTSRLYVFYDEAQRVDFDTQWQTPQLPDFRTVTLRINCRNTREIFDLMQYFHPAPQLNTITAKNSPVGAAPELISLPNHTLQLQTTESQEREQLESTYLLQLLDRLINGEKINPHHILIVTCRLKETPRQETKKAPPRKVSQFRRWQTDSTWHDKGIYARYMGEERAGENPISILSLGSTKGLESHVVILVELDGLPQEPTRRNKYLYLAISRCRHRLYILGVHEELNEFRATYTPS
jgi:hypothetical protein